MDGSEKRRAVRVACSVPMRIGGGGRWLPATGVNVSRTGVRLTVPSEALGLEGEPTALSLAQRLCELIPTRTPAEFDPSRLGSLLARNLDVVRVGLSRGPDPKADLGCNFDRPLLDVDVAALGVPVLEWAGPESGTLDLEGIEATADGVLPMPGVRPYGEDPLPELQEDGSQVATSNRRCQGILLAHGDVKVQPLVAWTQQIDTTGAVLLVPQRRVLPIPTDIDDDVSRLLLELCHAYGSKLTLKIVDDGEELWTGPVLLRAAELYPPAPDALLIDLCFARSLVERELSALDLA